MVIIVLGMHRSGTSLVSGILHNMGVNMGDKLLKGNVNNPKGFFEDVDFYRLNMKLLSESGGDWRNPPKIRILNDVFIKNKKEIKRLLDSKNKNKLWGWKDPRTVLTIGAYMPFLNQQNTKFVVVYRNVISIARSLDKKKKKRVKFIDSIELSSIYERRLAEFIKKNKRYDMLFLSYENILNNKEGNLQKISSFINLPFTKKNLYFIDPNLDRSSKF